jgi:peptide/nickel transport system substrate-binding protein
MERLQNVETYHAKIVTGAYDYAVGNTDVLNFQTYDESAEAGDYTVGIWSSGRGSEVFFQVNLNDEDEVLRAIHQDVRYRRALSLAINREEMNDLLFFGQATIRQMTVLPTSVNFKQEYADAFIDYDAEQANSLLDEMGLAWNGDKTIRLRSDGKEMKITFDFFDGEGPKTSILELVTEYWRAIGIDVSAKSITRQLLSPRMTENKESMSMWHGDASTDILLPVDRKWSIGKVGDECTIAPVWNDWFQSDGTSGEEPPDWYKEPLMAWKRYNETLDPDAAAQFLQSQADNLWSIGTVGMTPWLMIAKNNLGNVPLTGIHTWDGLFQYPYHAETTFFR